MLIISTVLILIYSVFILLIVRSWNSMKMVVHDIDEDNKLNHFISVLIPVRNESKNIETLIRSIYGEYFDQSNLETIVIDDHSRDDTKEIVTILTKEFDNLKLISLDEGFTGKKKAVERGVAHANGEIIVCTDGDCRVSPNWLASYSKCYAENANSVMAFGGVRFVNNNSIAASFLNIELSILQMIGGASIKLGIPSMINGANLSYKKKVFCEVDGYVGNESVPSGDDEFLLRKIHAEFQGQIVFLKDQSAVVDTLPPSSFGSWVNQRRRWAAKWKHHGDVSSKLIAVFIFLFNAFSIYMIISIFLGNDHLPSMLFLLVKAAIEYVLISISTRFLGVRNTLLTFVCLQLIYPFYVVFFGLASNFGKYNWKGREYNN